MTWVVDASVAMKWFVQEVDSDNALALLDQVGPLAAPDLLLAEVLNGLWRLKRKGKITLLEPENILRTLRGSIGHWRGLHELADQAAAISALLDHPVYDCFYLALAQNEGIQLITADMRLLERLQETRLANLAVDLGKWRPAE